MSDIVYGDEPVLMGSACCARALKSVFKWEVRYATIVREG